MNPFTLETVLSHVWQAVFVAFDGRPELASGETAHAIATAAEDAARRAYLEAVSVADDRSEGIAAGDYRYYQEPEGV